MPWDLELRNRSSGTTRVFPILLLYRD